MAKIDSLSSHESQRRAAKLMKRIVQQVKSLMDEKLRPHGVTTAQIRLLAAIRNAPLSSGAELARQCEITPQAAQALIERAEDAGWIFRAKDSVNDRIVTASLTPAGEDLLKVADRLMKSIEAKLWHAIPQPTIDRLNTLLERCLGNLTAEG